ncbi:hypothetical protein AVEN_103892-1 [Araneus ventricosus]|uniref:RNase H type-1 domain-containing protein n=1 Tax=Araneus ventricosus TaxID=182803 RepID=A0A4Y2K573_ARAVE|nr:hypothetical protein AVEN_103892-1 [Araneus ventricosus]
MVMAYPIGGGGHHEYVDEKSPDKRVDSRFPGGPSNGVGLSYPARMMIRTSFGRGCAVADLDTSTNHIITFPDTLFPRNNFCEIHLSDFSFQNKAHPVFLIKDLFEEAVSEKFYDYHIIATDASKSHSFTSIAGISNLHSFVYRIHPINSIFTAEALAICQALDELSVTDKNLLLLTDSY